MNSIDGSEKVEIINGQLCHFFPAGMGLGLVIAQDPGVNVENAMPKHSMHRSPY